MIKIPPKWLSYSAKSSESQHNLLLTLLELKQIVKFEHFVTRLAQLCESWNNWLNNKVELNHVLDSWNRASGGTLEGLIPLLSYGVMLMSDDPRYWR